MSNSTYSCDCSLGHPVEVMSSVTNVDLVQGRPQRLICFRTQFKQREACWENVINVFKSVIKLESG